MAIPKVLVVDKDHETRAYVSDVLAESGFHVDVAVDAQTALEKCESQDVLLVELRHEEDHAQLHLHNLWDTARRIRHAARQMRHLRG